MEPQLVYAHQSGNEYFPDSSSARHADQATGERRGDDVAAAIVTTGRVAEEEEPRAGRGAEGDEREDGADAECLPRADQLIVSDSGRDAEPKCAI